MQPFSGRAKPTISISMCEGGFHFISPTLLQWPDPVRTESFDKLRTGLGRRTAPNEVSESVRRTDTSA